MKYATRLAVEAIVVGLVLAAAQWLYKLAVPESIRDRDWKEAGWMVLVGGLVHLGFEVAGLNRTYCMTGAACN